VDGKTKTLNHIKMSEKDFRAEISKKEDEAEMNKDDFEAEMSEDDFEAEMESLKELWIKWNTFSEEMRDKIDNKCMNKYGIKYNDYLLMLVKALRSKISLYLNS
jgi:uncharacterized damage-inducible protein DinB